MREIVIDEILKSAHWQKCIRNGMEDEMPDLSKVSVQELLDWFLFVNR